MPRKISKKATVGYRRTPMNLKGRPRKSRRKLKRFIGRVTFDAKLERALILEQRRREKIGQKSARAVVIRELLIKGLRDKGYDPGEAEDPVVSVAD